MSKKLYNKDQIISIEIFKFEKDEIYTYIPEQEKKYFFGKFKKHTDAYISGGLFGTTWPVNLFEKNLNKECFLEDGVVYTRPRVEINFVNDINEIRYFKTDKECEKFVEKIIGYPPSSNFIEF